MLANRSKLFTVGCLLLGLLFCIVGVMTLTWYKKTTECFKVRPPLRSFAVTIDTSQSQQLIEQLQKFADQNGFKYQIAYYTPNGEDFSVWMDRKDIEVVVRNPFDPGEFKIGFYNYDCIHPTVASDIGDLFNDLKAFISEIPSAKITEEK